jgi:hypothetical protein
MKWATIKRKPKNIDADYEARSHKNATRGICRKNKAKRDKIVSERKARISELKYDYARGDDSAWGVLKGCANKIGFSTLLAVQRHAMARYVAYSAKTYAYKCKTCGKYHVTGERIPGKEYEWTNDL